MKNCYDRNETMKLLGYQDLSCINVPSKAIHDIAEARADNFDMDVAYDFFLLGYIYGKRAERRRKKNK